jgi:hypothetical protein
MREISEAQRLTIELMRYGRGFGVASLSEDSVPPFR